MRSHRALIVFAAVIVLATCAMLPFADHRGGATPSFVPAMLAVVACFDVISVFLLLGDYDDTGDLRVLAMCGAYLWSLVLMTGYALVFPGVFGTHPPLAITASVAPWLYLGWHAGFPTLLGVAWAPWPRRWVQITPVARRGRARVGLCAAAIAVAAAAIGAALAAAHQLPVVIHGLDTSRMTSLTAPVTIPLVLLSLVSCAHGCAQRRGPERWSVVTVLVCLCDLSLTYTAHYRFSVGWYAGRSLTLVAAGTVLVAMLGDFRRLKAEAQHNAAYDELTGLFNRRIGHEAVVSLVARAQRSGAPLGALLIDLDHFKDVNDMHGHAAGDRVLRATGAALTGTLRAGDVVARVGGEEFLVLLPDTDIAGSAYVAEKVRAALAALTVTGLTRTVTASVGATEVLAGDDSGALLARVDEAMYLAKAMGRDQVVCAAPVRLAPDELSSGSAARSH